MPVSELKKNDVAFACEVCLFGLWLSLEAIGGLVEPEELVHGRGLAPHDKLRVALFGASFDVEVQATVLQPDMGV